MRKPALLLVGTIAVLVVGAILSATNSAFGLIAVTPYEADINKDANVNAIDLMLVAQRFGQPVPTATATAIPVGGGLEYTIARDVVLNSGQGSTWFFARDPSACPGGVLYLAGRSLTGSQSSVALTVFGSSVNVNLNPEGSYYTFQQDSQTGIEIAPMGGTISVMVTLEMHCRPVI